MKGRSKGEKNYGRDGKRRKSEGVKAKLLSPLAFSLSLFFVTGVAASLKFSITLITFTARISALGFSLFCRWFPRI